MMSMEQTKRQIHRLMRQVLPLQQQDDAKIKKYILKLQGDNKKYSRIQERLNSREVGAEATAKQMLASWYRLEHSRGDEDGDDGWTLSQRKNKRKTDAAAAGPTSATSAPRRQATASMPSSSPSPSTAITTTAASRTPTTPSTRTQPAKNVNATARKTRAEWKDLLVPNDSPLTSSDQQVIPKLDLNTPAERAKGYHFCSANDALSLLEKYGPSAANPIVFIVKQFDNRADEDRVRRGVEELRHGSEYTMFPQIDKAVINVYDPIARDVYPRMVLMLQVLEHDPVRPDHQQDFFDGGINMEVQENEELRITIVQPMCHELALDEWWDRLEDLAPNLLKDEIKKLLSGTRLAPGAPIALRRDRTLKWRGETMPHAKLHLVVSANPAKVDELLAKSGQQGVLVEHASRDANDYMKIKMPLDMTLTEVLEAIDGLPLALRSLALGVVPTFKGYAVRTRQQDEAELTKALTPERADQLGPALGLKVASTWIVRGIPAKATAQQITTAMARPTSKWDGWTVIPRKRIGAARGHTADWMVDAADDPPSLRSVVNGTPIAIKRYVDESRATSRTSAWAVDARGGSAKTDDRKPEARTNPFFPPEEEDDLQFEDIANGDGDAGDRIDVDHRDQDDQETADQSGAADDPMAHNPRLPPRPSPKAAPYLRTSLRTSPAATTDSRVMDRSRSPPVMAAKPNADSVIAQLRQDIANRDTMIASLNQNIMALTAQMSDMQAQFQRQMQEQQQQQQMQQQMFQQQMAQMQAAFQSHTAASAPADDH